MHKFDRVYPREGSNQGRFDVVPRDFVDKRFHEADHPEVVARPPFRHQTVHRLYTDLLIVTSVRPVVVIAGAPVLDDIEAAGFKMRKKCRIRNGGALSNVASVVNDKIETIRRMRLTYFIQPFAIGLIGTRVNDVRIARKIWTCLFADRCRSQFPS